jgi:hypothetical protein
MQEAKKYAQKDPYRDFLYKVESQPILEEPAPTGDRISFPAIPSVIWLLAVVVKLCWIGIKALIRIAIRVPRWFVSVNTPKSAIRGKRMHI